SLNPTLPKCITLGWWNRYVLNRVALLAISFLLHNPSNGFAESLTSNATIEPNSTIVVLGDSITYQAHFTEYLRSFFDTRYPAQPIRLINAGTPGHRVADGIARFSQDVAKWNPSLVMIMFGMNDGGYATLHSDNRFDDYKNNLKKLVELIRSINAEPIIISPTPFDFLTSQRRSNDASYRFRGKSFAADYDQTLLAYTKWSDQFAKHENLVFIDAHTSLNEHLHQKRSLNPAFTLMPDAIHPDPAGHLLLAHTILKSLGPTRKIVFDGLFKYNGAMWQTAHQGGQIRSVNGDTTTITFQIKLNSLPWKVPQKHTLQDLRWKNPPNAMTMVEHLQLSNDYNASYLKIHGLENGDYQIVCDGILSGNFTQEALARGVNLASHEDLPWSRKATKVAELHRQLTDEIVRPMRNIAGQRFRVNRQAIGDLARFDHQNQSMVDEFKKKQTDLLKRIRQVNQPEWHEIQITKIPFESE
ncbi:MAG: SGNH/GDSL hydrolase family protein, partial [Rubripirellula sp.]